MNDTSAKTASPAHQWRFFRAGGFDQVRLESAADLYALGELDQKLWVALSCPVDKIEFPRDTLALLDADGDGHIRAAELIEAVGWCRERLADRDALVKGGNSLPLTAIATDSESGQRLRRSAEQILKNLGKAEAGRISLDDLADPTAIFGQTRFNGDGIITARSAEDEGLAAAIAAIGDARGTKIDRCGEAGVDAEAISGFFAEAMAHLEWRRTQPELPATLDPVAAAAAFKAVSGKVDDFFARCRMAAYDTRASGFMNGSDAELDAVGRASLATLPETLAALPIARVEAGRALPLAAGVNPAWQAALAELELQALKPLLGERAELTEADWGSTKARLAALSDWFAGQPACPAAPDTDTLRRWIADGVEARLLALVEQDVALTEEAAGIDEVRKLLFFVRDLATFANNFVSFRDFYTHQGTSTFQAGTLYLDGRSCDLTVAVGDVGAHAGLASLGKLYLVYCACRRGAETRDIVAAMTDGESDQLMVGRNGVFIDRNGVDWDARITRLVEHPISLRQAFWAPWRKISRMINDQLQKIAASKDQAVEKKAGGAVTEATTKAPDPKTPPAPFDVAKFAGIFAAIGLALGAIGTVIASLVTGFVALKWWQMPLAIAGLMLIVSGPSMVLAWFKLRNRTLGPLLDANGWAINARAAINIPFGRSLTHMAKLPPGAERALTDPYAEKGTPWGLYALVALALGVAAWWFLFQNAAK
jgi:hypothetical protein